MVISFCMKTLFMIKQKKCELHYSMTASHYFRVVRTKIT